MKVRLVAGFLALALSASRAAGAQTLPPATPPAALPSSTPAAAPSATPSIPPLQPAGVVPAAVTIQLAGTVTPAFVTARIRAAIDALTRRAPGTTLDIHGITLDGNLVPGSSLDAIAGVAIGGHGAYADVNGKTNVSVNVAALPPLEPAQLFYSDDPEYIPADADGVLFRGTMAPDTATRLLLYHVAAGAPRRVSLVLQTTGGPARVQRIGAAVGPSPAFAYVGQQATARFLLAQALQEGSILDLAPDVPLELPLGTLQPGDLIEAIDDFRVLSGGAVTLSVVTLSGTSDVATVLAAAELPDDTHGRRGIYALGSVPPIDLALTVGDPDPEPVHAGTIDEPNLRPDGRALLGDYGLVRRITLHLNNPTDRPQSAFLWERTEGTGGATVTILFDGEDAATTIPCVDDRTQPRLVRAFELAPGSTQTIGGTYMTDGASSYPIAFGLSLTPPLAIPPGACG
jgi:hypothetical protein